LAAHADDGDAQCVIDSIRRIVQATRVASRRSEHDVGASAAQLSVLANLAHGAAMSLNELAKRTATHQSSASVVVSKLVERGLVRRTRSTSDARRQQLSLTVGGRKLARVAPDAVPQQFLAALAAMPRRDVGNLARLLKQFVTNLGIV
jgi:DNA-binding MarR family transcriptional regulator